MSKGVKRFTPKEIAKPLGRWRIENCNVQMNKKIDLSNEDHCGPCGQYALEKMTSTRDQPTHKNIWIKSYSPKIWFYLAYGFAFSLVPGGIRIGLDWPNLIARRSDSSVSAISICDLRRLGSCRPGSTKIKMPIISPGMAVGETEFGEGVENRTFFSGKTRRKQRRAVHGILSGSIYLSSSIVLIISAG